MPFTAKVHYLEELVLYARSSFPQIGQNMARSNYGLLLMFKKVSLGMLPVAKQYKLAVDFGLKRLNRVRKLLQLNCLQAM